MTPRHIRPSPQAERDSLLTSLGLALILVGQPAAWWFRGNFTQSDSPVFPAIPLIFGFLLLVRGRPFRSPRLYAPPLFAGIYIFLHLLPAAAFALVAPEELLTDWTYGLFAIGVVAVLAITPLAALSRLPDALVIVGGISCFLPLYELATTPLVESFIRLNMKGNSNPLVLGTAGGITALAAIIALTMKRERTTLFGVVCGVAFVAGLGCVILSNTRSVMLGLTYTIPIYLLFLRPRLARVADLTPTAGARPFAAFFMVVAAAALSAPAAIAVVFDAERLRQVTGLFTDRLVGALVALSGDEFGVVDRSSVERLDIVRSTFEGLTPLGHGMQAQLLERGNIVGVGVYPHFTYLQAFYDFGFPGALLFTLTNLVLPLWLIFRRWRSGRLDPATTFIIALYLFSHIEHLTHGTPYFWFITLPVAMIYPIVSRIPESGPLPDGSWQGGRPGRFRAG